MKCSGQSWSQQHLCQLDCLELMGVVPLDLVAAHLPTTFSLARNVATLAERHPDLHSNLLSAIARWDGLWTLEPKFKPIWINLYCMVCMFFPRLWKCSHPSASAVVLKGTWVPKGTWDAGLRTSLKCQGCLKWVEMGATFCRQAEKTGHDLGRTHGNGKR
jgi:hypothetical protein